MTLPDRVRTNCNKGSVIMSITISLDRRARIAVLYTDLTHNLKVMDDLGLAIAATHVDHALAIIEAEACPEIRVIESDILCEALRAHARKCAAKAWH
jgi:hypothetical protein